MLHESKLGCTAGAVRPAPSLAHLFGTHGRQDATAQQHPLKESPSNSNTVVHSSRCDAERSRGTPSDVHLIGHVHTIMWGVPSILFVIASIGAYLQFLELPLCTPGPLPSRTSQISACCTIIFSASACFSMKTMFQGLSNWAVSFCHASAPSNQTLVLLNTPSMRAHF